MNLAYFTRKSIRNTFEFLKGKQEKAEDDPKVNEAFVKWNRRYHFLQRILLFALNSNLITLSSYSILNFLVFNKRKFVLVCYIPGKRVMVDQHRNSVTCNVFDSGLGLNPDPSAGFPDYEIQVAIHLACLFVGINELVALDGLYTYFIFNAASMADGLIIHVRNMSCQVRQNSINDAETRKCIKHLAQLHREYMDYVKRLDTMYYVMVLMQFGSFALSGSVGLYAARVVSLCNLLLRSKPHLSQKFYLQNLYLFFSRAIGMPCMELYSRRSFNYSSFAPSAPSSKIRSMLYTLLTLFNHSDQFFSYRQNTEISEELYGANWAEMNAENRRMMLFMLHHAKNTNTISVGHLSPLNLETGMSTYRILYSYFLLLQDAVKV